MPTTESHTGNALKREDFVQAVQADLQLVKRILQEDHRENHMVKIERAITLLSMLSKNLDDIGE